MRAVLGIDAAWTNSQPSGVALASEVNDGWRLVTVASSYAQFHSLAEDRETKGRPTGSIPNARQLISSANALCSSRVDVVAIDMPLSKSSIAGRRASDNAVSGAYGSRWASTHTPSIDRPGKISDHLRAEFGAIGFPLRTDRDDLQGLFEVYPHPAIIEFAAAKKRSPYKFGNSKKYWPELNVASRKANILREWAIITSLMENEIEGVERALLGFNPQTATGAEWKAREDMLDAIVCVAVGICILEKRALPFGDQDSAIWIPQPGCAKSKTIRSNPQL